MINISSFEYHKQQMIKHLAWPYFDVVLRLRYGILHSGLQNCSSLGQSKVCVSGRCHPPQCISTQLAMGPNRVKFVGSLHDCNNRRNGRSIHLKLSTRYSYFIDQIFLKVS